MCGISGIIDLENNLTKEKLADYVINNNFSVNVMKKQVKLIKNKILNERNSSRY